MVIQRQVNPYNYVILHELTIPHLGFYYPTPTTVSGRRRTPEAGTSISVSALAVASISTLSIAGCPRRWFETVKTCQHGMPYKDWVDPQIFPCVTLCLMTHTPRRLRDTHDNHPPVSVSRQHAAIRSRGLAL